MGNIGIVMKSATRSRFPSIFPGIYWEWHIIENPFGKIKNIPSPDTPERETITFFEAWEVTRQEAKEYINENGLVLAYKTKDGEIYDLPGCPFQKKYHLETKRDFEAIDRIWG